MKTWGGIASITVNSFVNYRHIFSIIEKYCKNIVEVKFNFSFEVHHAEIFVNLTEFENAESWDCNGECERFNFCTLQLKTLGNGGRVSQFILGLVTRSGL
jgi:hypothetical protein